MNGAYWLETVAGIDKFHPLSEDVLLVTAINSHGPELWCAFTDTVVKAYKKEPGLQSDAYDHPTFGLAKDQIAFFDTVAAALDCQQQLECIVQLPSTELCT